MRAMGRIIAGLGLLGILAVPAAWGESRSASLREEDEVEKVLGRYGLHPAFEKFGRGVSNTLGGWLELPLNVHTRYDHNDTVGSVATGMIYGVLKGVVRTGVGVYEAVTFLLPYPRDFQPILPTIAYFRKKDKHKPLLWE